MGCELGVDDDGDSQDGNYDEFCGELDKLLCEFVIKNVIG